MVNLPGHGFTEGGLSLMPLPVTFSSDTTDRVYKQVHGKSNSNLNKVVLLFGDDVPCKTSLKDAFVNYIYQTQVNDHYRLALIDDNVLEVDPRIKAYIFNVTEETLLSFNLILIDVPALGGLHSAESDIRTLMNLERFLQEEFKSTAVSAVNLVAPSSSVFFRPFINTYNLLNLSFEKLDTLAQILVTNSPTHMPFISCLRKVKISYNNLFTFYTEGQTSDEDDQFLSQIFLHYDYPGVDDFFQELKSIPPSNMSLVRKVDAGYVIPADIARLRVVNQFSETRGHRFGFGFRQLYMKDTFQDQVNKTRVLSIGKDNDNPNKIIIIVGNKLSGKTTVATAVVNHIFGVKFQDSFRLLIDDDLVSRFGKDNQKETTWTTAYCFNHIQALRLNYNLKIIDSAGFDDDDAQSNKTVVSKIAKLLKQICKTDSTTFLVFTAPGMQDNLPGSFKTIHKQLLRITDKGTDKMFFLDAYAPTQKSPVPKALKKLESSTVKVFKFDSRTYFPADKEPNHKEKYKEIINDMNWVIEHQTLEKFFGKLKL